MKSPSLQPLLRASAPRWCLRAPYSVSALSLTGTVALLATASALLLLGGCAHDDDEPTVAVSGLVVDGPLQGATVCYDLNDNGSCDKTVPAAMAWWPRCQLRRSTRTLALRWAWPSRCAPCPRK